MATAPLLPFAKQLSDGMLVAEDVKSHEQLVNEAIGAYPSLGPFRQVWCGPQWSSR